MSKIAGQFTWLAAGKFVKIFSGMIIMAMLSRQYGPDGLGQISFVLAISSLLLLVSNFGLQDLLVKEIAANLDHHKQQESIAIFHRARIIVVLFVVPIYYLLAINYIEHNILNMALLVGLFPILSIANIYESVYYGRKKAKYVVICQMVALFVGVLAKALVLVYGADLVLFICAYLLELLIYFLLIKKLLSGEFKIQFNFSSHFEQSISRIKKSLPVVLSGLSIIGFMKVDNFMIAYFLGMSELGVYSAAVLIAEYWLIIPTILIAAFFPYLTSCDSVNDRCELFQRLYNFITIIFFVSYLIVLFFGEYIVSILYGDGFSNSYDILKISFICSLFMAYRIVSGKQLLIDGDYNFILIRSISALAINIALNYVYIPLYGTIGAAWTSLITLFFIGFVSDSFFSNLRCHSSMKIKSIFGIFSEASRVMAEKR